MRLDILTGVQDFELRHYFESIDADGSEKVDWEELSSALRGFNRDITENELIMDLSSMHKVPLTKKDEDDMTILDKFDCEDHT